MIELRLKQIQTLVAMYPRTMLWLLVMASIPWWRF